MIRLATVLLVLIAPPAVYAQTPAGTLGQFITAPSPGLAPARGLLLHLKSSSAFRTNIGGVNIANAETTLTFKLYDKTGAVVSTKTETMPAYGVITPIDVVPARTASENTRTRSSTACTSALTS